MKKYAMRPFVILMLFMLAMNCPFEQTYAATMERVATYKNMLPETEYLFLVVKSASVSNVLDKNNLLFISQKSTDKRGKIKFAYKINAKYEDSVSIITGTEGNSIEAENIEINVTGEGMKRTVIVTNGEQVLEEGTDYEVMGTLWANKKGTHYFTVVGQGEYCGILTCSFETSRGDKGIETPKLKTLAKSGDTVRVKWSKVQKATKYIIYRKESGKTGWVKIATVKNKTIWVDKKVKKGKKYTYRVCAKKTKRIKVNIVIKRAFIIKI